jgi:hypothetical protein
MFFDKLTVDTTTKKQREWTVGNPHAEPIVTTNGVKQNVERKLGDLIQLFLAA